MKKKFLAMLLSMAMIVSGSIPAFAGDMNDAASGAEVPAVQKAGAEDAVSNAGCYMEQKGSLIAQVVEDKLAARRSASTFANSFATADDILLDTSYTDSMTSDNQWHFYRFTLEESGTLQLTFTAYFYELNYEILDQNGNKIGGKKKYWNSASGQISATEQFIVTSGVYTLVLISPYAGSYNFSLSNTPANESFKEGQGGSNNSIEDANSISTDTTYFGQIAINDDKDYYKVELPTSGKVSVVSTLSDIKMLCSVYDHSGECIWDKKYSASYNDYSECAPYFLNEDIELTSGTYYIRFTWGYDGLSQGEYNFKLGFQSAEESFKELPGGSNNSMDTANAIRLNTDYRGQIAHNDDKDFYKFTLSEADTITLSSTFYMEAINYSLFDEAGEQIWNDRFYWDSETGKKTIDKELELSSGTYYLSVASSEVYSSIMGSSGRRNSEGNYDFRINSNLIESPTTVDAFRIGGRAGDALRLNWSKNTTADGYIIEQYKNGDWTRIARIANNSTTTYRVGNLSPSTAYDFRICAFKLNGNAALYSTYTTVSGTTNPAIISGLTIGGRAGDALRLNWNQNSKASGYIVEQYKDGSWVRIARIGNNSTTTYRVEKLTPSTTYQFRVRAFGFDGNTALYGNYAYVNGTTNPATVSGVRIGGTAKDALRVNWNKDSKASGYIVEQYKDGSWVRVSRIGDNNATTYRISGLNDGTTYQFRVQAFNFEKNTPLYGVWSYVDGTTK